MPTISLEMKAKQPLKFALNLGTKRKRFPKKIVSLKVLEVLEIPFSERGQSSKKEFQNFSKEMRSEGMNNILFIRK